MSRGPRILVVDDNQMNRRLVTTLLEFEGYVVDEAADGAEGLAVAIREAPELVISDILMPSMDGYEFVRQLRARPATAEVPVIFYTANYLEREAQSLATQCGVSRVIVKPCPPAELIQSVRDTLSGTPETAPAAEAGPSEFDMEHLRLVTDKLSQKADALNASNSRLAALTELNLQMASEHDPRKLMRSVCVQSRKLLGARFSVLAIIDNLLADGLTVDGSGLARSLAGITDPHSDPGVLGEVFRDRASRRLAGMGGQPLLHELPTGFPPVHSMVAVPVASLTRTIGWLCLCDKLGASEFSDEDEQLLTTLGAQLGRIYENGHLYREVQEQAAHLRAEIEERARATEQLRMSEERFRELAANIHDVLFVANAELQTQYVSPGFERVWGRKAETMLNRRGAWTETVYRDDKARVEAEMQHIRQNLAEGGELEFRISRPDDSVRWVLSRLSPVIDADGQVTRIVGVMRDITDRKLAELRVMRLNRTYALLSGINSLIVRASNRDSLLKDACLLAVHDGGFRVAWCGLLNPETAEIAMAGSAGEPNDVAPLVNLPVAEKHAGESLVVEAMLSGRPGVCNDLTQPGPGSRHAGPLLAKGYGSLVVLPLLVAGKAAGCLILLTDVANYFDDEEMRLLEELAGDVSFALDHIGKSEQLRYLESFDPLTGLANRSEFERRLAQYVNVSNHSAARFAVVVIDPQRFEAINAALGRDAADQVLRQLGARLADAAGGAEIVGRVGSKQFAAIISGSVDGSGILRLLNELWQKWLGAPFTVNNESMEITVKAGVALFPADGITADALINNATAALANAKEGSKPVGFYTRQLSDRMTRRLVLERDLRHAIEHEEFELHYQPKVDLANRRISGFEALLRWRRPGVGLESPASFMPLLEETGLIVEVGEWVMDRACRDRREWKKRFRNVPRVAVNVSTVQLRRDDFVRTVVQVIQRAGDDAGLDLEVTESEMMDDVAENLLKLEAIRELGIGVALDDFGTGYSSLSYLAKLPVTVLKIDRSFVASMLDDRSVMTLVSTVISLARSLKLETVAEGVETEAQARVLRSLGCHQIQGYLISKPVPVEEVSALLANEQG